MLVSKVLLVVCIFFSTINVIECCPGSTAWFLHAACEVTVTVYNKTCGAVHAEIVSRVANSPDKWADPHNAGEYQFVHANSTYIRANRWTGAGSPTRYMDEMDFHLEQQGINCIVSGCSESQVTSVIDYGTNYCNLRNLYCNHTDGCNPTSKEGFFNYTEEVFNCGQHDTASCGTTPRKQTVTKTNKTKEKHAEVVVDNNGFSDPKMVEAIV